MSFSIHNLYFIIGMLLLSSVVFTVQTEAYQLERINKEKEGTPIRVSIFVDRVWKQICHEYTDNKYE